MARLERGVEEVQQMAYPIFVLHETLVISANCN
jgi:hypothetical protein